MKDEYIDEKNLLIGCIVHELLLDGKHAESAALLAHRCATAFYESRKHGDKRLEAVGDWIPDVEIEGAAIECGKRWGEAYGNLEEGQKWDAYSAGRKAFIEGVEWLLFTPTSASNEIIDVLEDLLEAIPKQTNDHDWWDDDLTHAVDKAKKVIQKFQS